ncbi:hypothetical protein FHS52_000174 [Erythromicrobium ramosum]|uniref:Uncharacterized protein n=1 Tax=Erythrobacter ramosus TaxID=35811 RepID=A0A6I4UG46_9SPHN|nr:hypothetical protein [Erythrobacter ramosus]MBB3774231.1 hypothetical protein [Erythrobacter ramosus]MXP38111.1 hypothetical protein [Erythrobacter ramosus]
MHSDLLDLFNTYRVAAQHLTSFLLAAAIWRWGGAPERWLIGVFIATMVLPMYVGFWLNLGALETGPYAPVIFLIDVIAAAMFVAIALNANRNYPLLIAGFQLVSVVAHLVQSMVDVASTLAFAILIISPSYGELLVLLGGLVRHWLRERRFGPYRDWRLTAPGIHWQRL